MYMAPDTLTARSDRPRANHSRGAWSPTNCSPARHPGGGRPPDALAVLSNEVDPLTLRNAEIPVRADEVCAGPNKEPNARFRTLREFAGELESLAASRARRGGGGAARTRARGAERCDRAEISAAEHSALESAGPTQTQRAWNVRRGRLSWRSSGSAFQTVVAAGVVATRDERRCRCGSRSRWTRARRRRCLRRCRPARMRPRRIRPGWNRCATGRRREQRWSSVAPSQSTHSLAPRNCDSHWPRSYVPVCPRSPARNLQAAHATQASLGTHDRILLDAFEHIAREPQEYDAGREDPRSRPRPSTRRTLTSRSSSGSCSISSRGRPRRP